jgi:CsoR family transcriptional regulator, copper-sensing transcriptional repressor
MKTNVKKRLMRRLKIIEGQIRGLQNMAEKNTYCIDVITQTQAIKEALSSLEDLMLENHLSEHVIDQMKKGEHKKAIKEILSVYKVSKRK